MNNRPSRLLGLRSDPRVNAIMLLVTGIISAAVLSNAFAQIGGYAARDASGIDASASHLGARFLPTLGLRQRIDHFRTLAVVDSGALDGMRGGFTIGGLDMQFGANVRTVIDGTSVLESIISLTQTGPVVERFTHSLGVVSEATQSLAQANSVAPSVPSHQGATDGSSSNNAAPLSRVAGERSGTTVTALTPHTVDLGALAQANGAIVNDSKGFTAVLHDINRDRFVSAIVNTALGRHIDHEVNLNVTIHNFKQFQQAMRKTLTTLRFSEAAAHTGL